MPTKADLQARIARAPDVDGIQGESDDYLTLVALARAGEDGPDTYEWDVGISP